MKQSGYLKKLELQRKADSMQLRRFAIQQSQDMAMIALNQEFGFGADRLRRFAERFIQVWDEYATLTLDDAKSDKNIEYSKQKVDDALKQICGDYFQPWDVRYD